MCCKCNQQTHMKVIMILDKMFMVCDVMLYIYAFRIEFEDALSKIFLTVVIVSFIVFEAISYELEVKKVVEASHLLNWFIQPHLDERQAACLTSKITLT